MFPDFHGNAAAVNALEEMIRSGRIAQTILLDGPAGVGKATLARRFAAALLGDAHKIEADDLSREENAAIVLDREKWTAEKRNEDPLLFASHPDFVTFAPDGPLRQLSIPQMRWLKERAQLKPLHGARRVFLIDEIDRANEQAANSLLKTLEEPPEHLVLILTARNPYDLLPTIRSRAVAVHLGPLSTDEVRAFLRGRGAPDEARRAALAAGSPGAAVSLDIPQYEARRLSMLALLRTAAGQSSFAEWAQVSEALSARRNEKLEALLGILYILVEDILLLAYETGEIRNVDIRGELQTLAQRVDFAWLRAAVVRIDELVEFSRRNIQKSIALDAFAIGLRP